MRRYADRLDSLRDVFGTPDVAVEDGAVVVAGRRYPVVDDVVVLLDPARWPEALRARLGGGGAGGAPAPAAASAAAAAPFAEDIQHTFGAEWTRFPDVLPEHAGEFRRYFDLVDPASLAGARVCDLGCGIGRWSHHLAPHCRELVLVDFSEAIFVARRNLADRPHALFFMADIADLPFRRDFADLVVCLGVLHHLPVDCLDAVRRLAPLAPRLLVYLYYALDGRGPLFRSAFLAADAVRRGASRVRSPAARDALTVLLALGAYYPFIGLGHALRPFGLARRVPLWEAYHGKGFERIRQDVYDRFFTRIEQRVSRRQVEGLSDTFARVTVSDGWPYWHFLCERT